MVQQAVAVGAESDDVGEIVERKFELSLVAQGNQVMPLDVLQVVLLCDESLVAWVDLALVS